MKKLWILLAVIGILLIAGVVFNLLRSPNSDTTGPGNLDPFGNLGGSNATSSAGTLQIMDRDGTTYLIPDPTEGRPSVSNTGGTYYTVTQDAQGTEKDPDYSIVYGTDSSIAIGLAAEPLSTVRDKAETRLKELFPLTDEQLCAMDVTVMTSPRVSEFYAGSDLGLSFCPGAVLLP